MERHIFLRFNMFLNYALGVKKIKTEYTSLNILHSIWAYLWVLSGVLFTFTHTYELLEIHDIMKFIENARVSTLTVFSFVKYYVVQSKRMRLLINHIRDTEQKILAYDNKDISDIFWKNQNISEKITKYFLAYGYWTLVVFYIYPVYYSYATPKNLITATNENGTIYYERPLPFGGEFPFDKYAYYKTVFAFQVCAGLFTASFTNISDIFFWATMLFGATHIKVLQYRLRYFKELSINDAFIFKSTHEHEKLIMKHLEDCIFEHRSIIKYIKELDSLIKYLMLVDSILSTLQIALIGLGCILSGFTLKQLNTLVYLSWNVGQLFFFYYCANEILLAGLDLPDAIWESDWHDCSHNTKKTLLFIMRRAAKPLVLNVGPFYQMTIPSMLNILKTAGSYFAVMRQMINK